MARLYVIGDKKTGVLFLKTDPLRSVIIPTAAIKAYAKAEKISFDEAFGRVGSVAKFVANKGSKSPRYPDNSPIFKAVGELIADGAALSDADFCFVADLSAATAKGFSASRFSSARFSSARAILTPVTRPFLPTMPSVTAWNSRSAPSACEEDVRILVGQ